MYLALGLLSTPIVALMGLKFVRTLQELRASRAGFITFGGDDWYQARDLHLDVHTAVMVARISLSMSPDAFDGVIRRIEENYLDWYEALDASIERPATLTFESPLEIWDTYRDYELSDAPLLAKVIICKKEQTILLLGNHVYLGGYLLSQFVQVVFCDVITKDVFPRNRYIPVVTELMMLAFFGNLALLSRPVRSPLYDHKSKIRRFYLKQSVASIQAMSDEFRVHSLYVIIATHVFMVMKHMNKDRIRVTLPVSFRDESSFNTVGGMLLDIEAEPDLETLVRKIKKLVKRRRWQVAATNHIQRVFPTRKFSENARNQVDLTLTVVPGKTLPHNLLTNEVENYEFTMDSIHYPVYVMAFIFEDSVYSSFMVNTPQFDVAGFITEEGATPMDLTLRRGSGTA